MKLGKSQLQRIKILTSGVLFYNNERQTFEINHTIILKTTL